MTRTRSARLRSLAPVLALVLALVVAGCAGGGSAPDAAPAGGSTGTPAADGAASGDAEGSNGETGPASYYGVEKRVVVRNAEMTLEVEDYESAFRKARAAVRRKGGYVADQTRNREGDWVTGRFVVKVPAEHFNDVRDVLAKLGTLEASTYRAEDFTKRYATRQSRLEQLREREAELEAELANASGHEREEIEADLEDVRAKIRDLSAAQAALQRRARLSTVVVTMHEPEGAKPPKNHETAFGFDDALLEGLYGGLTVLKGAVVAIGFLVPVVLTGAILVVLALVTIALLLAIRRHLAPRIWALFALENRLAVEDEPGGEA